MSKIGRVGFVIKPHAPGVEVVLRDLVAYLGERGIASVLEDMAAQKLGRARGLARETLPEKVDLVVVLGGDGTLLSVAYKAARAGVPVMGVNLGRLGFLTEIPVTEARLVLDLMLTGKAESIISPRRLIEARCRRKVHLCLNDVVINKGAKSRMIQIAIRIDDEEVAGLKADGVIVSTPTGSTAYSLSAGGPIVQPRVPAVVLSPICPHTLTFRPMVISTELTIGLKLITDGEEVYLTLDGQRGGYLKKNDEVEVRTSPLELKLVTSPQRNYFNLVKEKLGWAE
jgi:NAD+ kinase